MTTNTPRPNAHFNDEDSNTSPNPAFESVLSARLSRIMHSVRVFPETRLLICGQAPGRRVHESGLPFTDPSGDRLRDWTGLSEAEFYDRDRVAIVPMAFCFPGYDAKGADLPPPPLCAATWRAEAMAAAV